MQDQNIKTTKKNSNRLILANITSKLGNMVFDYTNQLLITKVFPNQALFMSLYQSSENTIQILFNLIGGVFSDRTARKKMLIVTDMLSGFFCLIGLLFHASPQIYWIILSINILLAVASAFNSPSYNAMMKECIDSTYIEKHLSYSNMYREIFSILSPTIGLLIWNIGGFQLAYLVNTITFFVSAFIEWKIVILFPKKKVVKKAVMTEMKEGFQYIWKEKNIMKLLIFSSLVNLLFSGYNLMLPYTTNYFQGHISNFYGKILIGQSVGAIIFSTINAKLDTKKNNILMFSSIFICGLSITLFALLSQIKMMRHPLIDQLFYLWPFILFGGSLTLYNIHFFTNVQKNVDSEFLGRVMSVIFTIAVLLMPIGSFCYGIFVSVDQMLYLLWVGVPIMIVTVIFFLNDQKIKQKNKIE